MATCCPPPSPILTMKQPLTMVTPKVHIHLHVTNIAESIAFYRAFFGTDPVKSYPGYAKFLPAWAPINLALSEHQTQNGSSVVSHMGIQLPDAAAVRRQQERVQAAGLSLRVETGVDCCYANQDKFWVRDPSGIDWEVYCLNHDIGSDGRDISQGSSCCVR